MLIAHGPVAILATKLVNGKKLKELDKRELLFIFLFSFFLGLLPDFDILFLASIGKPAFIHHSLLTHTPIFWSILAILLFLALEQLKWPFSKQKREIIYTTFLVSTISHSFTDMLGGHIMFFTPFYNKYLTIIGNYFSDSMFGGYLANPLFGLEILIISTCLVVLIHEFLGKKLYLFLLIPILYIFFNTLIYFSVYRVDLYTKENGNPVYDTDRDRLADSYDFDFDNNLINNFDQVSKQQLFQEFQYVYKQTKLLPSQSRSFVEEFKYLYGGHTVLRAILQSYAQTGNYLAPVVHDYMFKNNIEKFSQGLYEYLFSTNTFKPFGKVRSIEKGSLVIIKYTDTKYSLGIVIDKGNAVIEDINGFPRDVDIQSLPTLGEVFIQE